MRTLLVALLACVAACSSDPFAPQSAEGEYSVTLWTDGPQGPEQPVQGIMTLEHTGGRNLTAHIVISPPHVGDPRDYTGTVDGRGQAVLVETTDLTPHVLDIRIGGGQINGRHYVQVPGVNFWPGDIQGERVE